MKFLKLWVPMFLIVMMISAPFIGRAEQEPITHIQEIFTITYGCTLDLSVASSEKDVELVYKNYNETEWNTLQMMKDTKNENFIGTLPVDALTPPGVEYYFRSPGYKTDIYKIRTEYDPISGNPHEIGIMAATGEVIGYDLQYHSGKLPNGKTVSISTQTPTGNYPSVTSKLWELRSTGSNPHMGIDLNVYMVNVYAMANGRIDFVNTNSSNDAGIYIRIVHNADGTTPNSSIAGTLNGDLYSHYFHLNNVTNNPSTGEMWKQGDIVSRGDLIAVSGDTGIGGYHLDFGWDMYTSSKRIPLPGKYFFDTSSWNNGMDLDFIQPPRTWYDSKYGTMLEIYIYPKGTTDSSTVNPILYIGSTTGTPTKQITVFRDPNNSKRFYAYLAGAGYDNGYANLYISVTRNGISGYVTRPIEKFNAIPSKFYKVYIQPGSITLNQMPDEEPVESVDAVELTE
ncbi:MAG: hypothetical protein HPY66_1066 [Firmicutes bacterium]|nr:hypothetical protein [Bacillota bacterium]MDI6706881.1 M23 family metallopeptidase [Bacillota bacterium]